MSGWKPVGRGELDNLFTIGDQQYISIDDESARIFLGDRVE
jgi:hypothetical protein